MASNPANKYSIQRVDPTAGLEEAVRELSLGGKSKDGFLKEGPTKMVDTFWPKKRSLMSDYSKFLEIDRRAAATPPNLRKDPLAFVDCLVQLGTTDIQKYRAIFAWIITSITTWKRSKKTPSPPSDVRQAISLGVSGASASLPVIFKELCSLAGLPCLVVSGYTKPLTHFPGTEKRFRQLWNIITIDKERYYCDITWAQWNKLTADEQPKTECPLFNEEYFVAEPNQFTSEHLPIKDSVVDVDLQYCTSPYTSIEEWNSSLSNGPMMPCLGVEYLDLCSIITTKDNTAKAHFQCPRGIRLLSVLRPQEGEGDLEDHVLNYWEADVITFLVRLPGRGKYVLQIFGIADNLQNHQDSVVPGLITTIAVLGEGEAAFKPFPKKGTYGVLPKVLPAGYACVSHKEPIIDTSSNKLTIEFARPPDGSIIPQLFHENRPKMKIINSIYREILPRKIALHLALSKPGSYLLEIYALYDPQSTSTTHGFAGRFIINSTSQEEASFFADPNPWGPQKLFRESNISCLDVDGSTIHTSEGEGRITFTSPIMGGEDLAFKLDVPGSKGTWNPASTADYNSWVFGEIMKREGGMRYTRFNFRIPEEGFYEFELFYGGKSVGRWLLACSEPYMGALFPSRDGGLWGLSKKMAEDLKMTFSRPVHLEAPGGEVDVAVNIPSEFHDWCVFFHLKDADGPRLMSQSEDKKIFSTPESERKVTFHVKLHEDVNTAILTLNIGQKKSENSTVITVTEQGCMLVSRA